MRLSMGTVIGASNIRGGGAPGVILPPLYTDFSEYALGVQPSDWTLIDGYDGFTIESKADAVGGRALRYTGEYSNNSVLRWDIDSIGDIEVEAKMLADAKIGNQRLRVYGRVGTGHTGYNAFLTGHSSNEFEITLYDNDVVTDLAGDGNAYSWAKNIWYIIKLHIKGNEIKAKFWVDGEVEPSDWFLSAVNSVLADGKVGVGIMTTSTDQQHWVDWIRVTSL